MSAKHTPGPWAQHPSFPWIIKQDSTPIADVEYGVTVCNTTAHESSGFFPTPEEGRANARLIAAAPELLEALRIAEQFMSIASDWNIDEAEIDGEMRNTYDLRDIARAAIAKATGDAS